MLRAVFSDVTHTTRSVYGLGVDNTLFLNLSTNAARFRFELTCAGGAERVVDELQGRTAGSIGVPAWMSGPRHSCN